MTNFRPGAGVRPLSRRDLIRVLTGAVAAVVVDAPLLAEVPCSPHAGERWAELYLPEGEGPFRALVRTSPAGALVPLFTHAAITEMTTQLDPHRDVYGGVAWDRDQAGVALLYRDADDIDAIRVEPDARGLYDLGQIEWAWEEH